MDANDANATKKSTFCVYLVFNLHIATKLKFEKFWLSNLWKFRCRGISLWFEWRHQRCTISPRSRGGPSNDENDLKYMKNIKHKKGAQYHDKTKYQGCKTRVRAIFTISPRSRGGLLTCEDTKITKDIWRYCQLYLLKVSEVHHFIKEQRWAVKLLT